MKTSKSTKEFNLLGPVPLVKIGDNIGENGEGWSDHDLLLFEILTYVLHQRSPEVLSSLLSVTAERFAESCPQVFSNMPPRASELWEAYSQTSVGESYIMRGEMRRRIIPTIYKGNPRSNADKALKFEIFKILVQHRADAAFVVLRTEIPLSNLKIWHDEVGVSIDLTYGQEKNISGLHVACFVQSPKKRDDKIAYFINKGAKIVNCTWGKYPIATFFHVLLRRGYFDSFLAAIDLVIKNSGVHGIALNACDGEGNNLLLLASKVFANQRIIRKILNIARDQGIDIADYVNALDNKDRSALHFAAAYARIPNLCLFLEAGARNIRDKTGCTPLDCTFFGEDKLQEIFKEVGLSPDRWWRYDENSIVKPPEGQVICQDDEGKMPYVASFENCRFFAILHPDPEMRACFLSLSTQIRERRDHRSLIGVCVDPRSRDLVRRQLKTHLQEKTLEVVVAGTSGMRLC